jgi:endonuclease-3 related protein
MTAEDLLERLGTVYPAADWWPSESAFETAVGAILVQGVAWKNAARAIAGLRAARLLGIADIVAADPDDIAAAVRPALYHNQKARYLKAFASFLVKADGLDAVARLPRARQKEALLGVLGIGEETAAAIMVYALGGREPVVDAYARRLLPRIGAVTRADDSDIEAVMRAAIGGAPERARALHAVIVEHARTVCRKKPLCDLCPLAVSCPHSLGETG